MSIKHAQGVFPYNSLTMFRPNLKFGQIDFALEDTHTMPVPETMVQKVRQRKGNDLLFQL